MSSSLHPLPNPPSKGSPSVRRNPQSKFWSGCKAVCEGLGLRLPTSPGFLQVGGPGFPSHTRPQLQLTQEGSRLTGQLLLPQQQLPTTAPPPPHTHRPRRRHCRDVSGHHLPGWVQSPGAPKPEAQKHTPNWGTMTSAETGFQKSKAWQVEAATKDYK